MLPVMRHIYLRIGVVLKWLLPQAPYLMQEAAKAPDVTGCGVLPAVYGLRSCPLQWDFTTIRYKVVLVSKVSGHAKITNL